MFLRQGFCLGAVVYVVGVLAPVDREERHNVARSLLVVILFLRLLPDMSWY